MPSILIPHYDLLSVRDLIYRLKKGLRIYAMYPHTTSLYVATVVDNTTYCRGDDDIIVVEFDEDERGKQSLGDYRVDSSTCQKSQMYSRE